MTFIEQEIRKRLPSSLVPLAIQALDHAIRLEAGGWDGGIITPRDARVIALEKLTDAFRADLKRNVRALDPVAVLGQRHEYLIITALAVLCLSPPREQARGRKHGTGRTR